jgi:hypothetical protein
VSARSGDRAGVGVAPGPPVGYFRGMRSPSALLLAALVLVAACSRSDGGPAPARGPEAGPPAAAPLVSPEATAAGAAAPSRAEAENWSAALEAPATARAGERAAARLVLEARGGMKVNREYPLAFRPAADGDVEFEGDRLLLRDVAKFVPCEKEPEEPCALSADVGFVPRAAGEVRVAGSFAFSVCDDERCLIERVPLGATVLVR